MTVEPVNPVDPSNESDSVKNVVPDPLTGDQKHAISKQVKTEIRFFGIATIGIVTVITSLVAFAGQSLIEARVESRSSSKADLALAEFVERTSGSLKDLFADMDVRGDTAEKSVTEVANLLGKVQQTHLIVERQREQIESQLESERKRIIALSKELTSLSEQGREIRQNIDALSGVKDFSQNVAEIVATKMSSRNELAALLGGLPVGSILAYGGASTESLKEWEICAGQSLPIDQYPLLYERLGKGTLYGSTGKEFRLPDLQGVFLRGLDPTGKVDTESTNRMANATSPDIVGSRVGSFQPDSLRSHSHHVSLSGGEHSHAISFTAAVAGQGGDTDSDPNGAQNRQFQLSTARDGGHTHDGNTDPFGNVETRPKNVAVYWIIKTK